MSWFEKPEEILNAVHNGVLAIDDQDRIVIYNCQAERMLGVPFHEVIKKKISDVFPQSILPVVLRTRKSYNGRKLHMNNRLLVTNNTPVIEGERLVGAIAVFQDVSDLESLATELRQVQEMNKELEAILESIYDGIGIIDRDGTVLAVNTSYERVTGLSSKDVVRKNVRELESSGTVSQAVGLLVLNQKKSVTIKQKIKTGKEILITGSPVFDDEGDIQRIVCSVRDMTELNLLRERVENTEEQNLRYANEIKELRAKLWSNEEFIFRSSAMERVFQLIARVARVNTHVLITGESGVGKEVVASLIHKLSQEENGPFLQINCGAIPETLLESELFGYEDGAFTGARSGGKKGIFELCEGGTLLLDEIGEMPMNMQVRLLRVLQQHEVIRIGGAKPIKCNVRVLAAANKDLEEMVAQNLFRADLFYRLNVVPIHIPPLRERRDDIVPLTLHFLKKFNRKYNINKRFDPEVLQKFERHEWSGNVRQLENLVERLIILNEDEVLTVKHLPFSEADDSGHLPLSIQVNEPVSLEKAVEMVEKELLMKTIKAYPSIRQAAKILGVTHPTVLNKIQKYNLTRKSGWEFLLPPAEAKAMPFDSCFERKAHNDGKKIYQPLKGPISELVFCKNS